MCESKLPVAVGLDEVVDPEAFRALALRAELGLPSEEVLAGESERA